MKLPTASPQGNIWDNKAVYISICDLKLLCVYYMGEYLFIL